MTVVLAASPLILACSTGGAPVLAGWYAAGSGTDREMYVSVANQTAAAISVHAIIVNEDERGGWTARLRNETLGSGELALVPFTEFRRADGAAWSNGAAVRAWDCRLPVSLVVVTTDGKRLSADGLPASLSGLPQTALPRRV
jgi:hypothetical protein